jgi:DegV family protein with EDD domain
MTVKIVTDSGADLPLDLARELGITVVPVYLRFGDKVYRDGVDIGPDEFYAKLMSSSVLPSTSAPSAGDFAQVYSDVASSTDEIVSIHITRRHSTTYDTALLGSKMMDNARCRIEVIDSEGVTMWQGLVVLAAARAAEAGCELHDVVKKVQETIRQMRALALLDTVKYIAKGGRIGNAFSKVESILNLKALLTLRNGVLRPAGLARNRNKGIGRLREFIRSALHIEELAIIYSTTPDDARKLAADTVNLLPNLVPKIVRLGPALGVHAGPGAIIVIVRQRD